MLLLNTRSSKHGQGQVAAFFRHTRRDDSLSQIIPTTVYCGKTDRCGGWTSTSSLNRHAPEIQRDENTVPTHLHRKSLDVVKLLQTINFPKNKPAASVDELMKFVETRSSDENVNSFSTDEETTSTVSMTPLVTKVNDTPRLSIPLRTKSMSPPLSPRRRYKEEARQGDCYNLKKSQDDRRELPPSAIKSQSKSPIVNERHRMNRKGKFISDSLTRDVCRSSESCTPSSQDIHERLYNRCKTKQTDGKERRKAIAKANLERRRIPSPEDFGKISQSRAGDMYDRGMSYLRTKQGRLHKKQGSGHKPAPTPAIPISKATDVYDRGMHFLQSRAINFEKRRIGSNEATSLRSSSSVSTDTPRSVSVDDTHNKSVAVKHSKKKRYSKICAENKKKEEPCTIPISQATNLYDRGIEFLQAKASRLDKRQVESVRKKPISLVIHTKSPPTNLKSILHSPTSVVQFKLEGCSKEQEENDVRTDLLVNNPRDLPYLVKSNSPPKHPLSHQVNMKLQQSIPDTTNIKYIKKMCVEQSNFVYLPVKLKGERKSLALSARSLRSNIFQESTRHGISFEVVLYGTTNTSRKKKPYSMFIHRRDGDREDRTWNGLKSTKKVRFSTAIMNQCMVSEVSNNNSHPIDDNSNWWKLNFDVDDFLSLLINVGCMQT